MIVRDGTGADLPALTAIYNHYVVNTAVTFDLEPFAVHAREAWLDRYATSGRYRLLVAVEGSEPVGYATSSRFREKAAYDTSVETTVYCHPDAVGRGVGSALYGRLFDVLAAADVHRALAGVTVPNEASVALHRKFGFDEVGAFSEVGRKHGRYWDVQWFERAVPGT